MAPLAAIRSGPRRITVSDPRLQRERAALHARELRASAQLAQMRAHARARPRLLRRILDRVTGGPAASRAAERLTASRAAGDGARGCHAGATENGRAALTRPREAADG